MTDRPRRRRKIATLGLAVTGIAVAGLTIAGCASVVPNRDAVTKPFPSVEGRSLSDELRRIPEDLSGPAVVLVGYVQNAQFDIDRWLIGLSQLETPVEIVELPTIEGLLPGLFAGKIDSGMRSGIPNEDWPAVVTLYGADAERVVDAFGNETPRNGRVALIDREGMIVWFHDRGFSAAHLLELDKLAREL